MVVYRFGGLLVLIPSLSLMNLPELLTGYDLKNLTVGVLGGHSALDVCHGAKQAGFKTICVTRKDRQRAYAKYFRTREAGRHDSIGSECCC